MARSIFGMISTVPLTTGSHSFNARAFVVFNKVSSSRRDRAFMWEWNESFQKKGWRVSHDLCLFLINHFYSATSKLVLRGGGPKLGPSTGIPSGRS